ncbi:MAG: hypothetical protein JHC93_08300 [Parachlamydiales bacterium]|nr:hypothetical protein [Parachlamydiales bacterium]
MVKINIEGQNSVHVSPIGKVDTADNHNPNPISNIKDSVDFSNSKSKLKEKISVLDAVINFFKNLLSFFTKKNTDVENNVNTAPVQSDVAEQLVVSKTAQSISDDSVNFVESSRDVQETKAEVAAKEKETRRLQVSPEIKNLVNQFKGELPVEQKKAESEIQQINSNLAEIDKVKNFDLDLVDIDINRYLSDIVDINKIINRNEAKIQDLNNSIGKVEKFAAEYENEIAKLVPLRERAYLQVLADIQKQEVLLSGPIAELQEAQKKAPEETLFNIGVTKSKIQAKIDILEKEKAEIIGNLHAPVDKIDKEIRMNRTHLKSVNQPKENYLNEIKALRAENQFYQEGVGVRPNNIQQRFSLIEVNAKIEGFRQAKTEIERLANLKKTPNEAKIAALNELIKKIEGAITYYNEFGAE